MTRMMIRDMLEFILVLMVTIPLSIYMHRLSYKVIGWYRKRFKPNKNQLIFVITGVCLTRFNILFFAVTLCYKITERI